MKSASRRSSPRRHTNDGLKGPGVSLFMRLIPARWRGIFLLVSAALFFPVIICAMVFLALIHDMPQVRPALTQSYRSVGRACTGCLRQVRYVFASAFRFPSASQPSSERAWVPQLSALEVPVAND